MTEQMYKNRIWLGIISGKYFLTVIYGSFFFLSGTLLPARPQPDRIAPKWGFYAHQQINRLAVFTLPPEMMPLYKSRIQFLTDNAVNPDKRRYAVAGEAPRHFIDLDAYADTTRETLPRSWSAAADRYGADTLALHGIVPWHIQLAKYQLTEAFKERNVPRILRLSADIGHYIADANVPLHTTRNYNGQLTGQTGIHGFWESRLPELFSGNYDVIVGAAEYIEHPQQRAWRAVFTAHAALDSVLAIERDLTAEAGDSHKWNFEDRNGQTVKVYSEAFARQYHERLRGQVERQMRASIKMVGDFWYTCWVDAGQPDLKKLARQLPDETEKTETAAEQQSWLKRLFKVREE
ncbi:zinc dependent phospholipase C family protein [Fibrella forsythiae]|nr:zinc dependent phospholipase C family protein [Fibrella forsythiae]